MDMAKRQLRRGCTGIKRVRVIAVVIVGMISTVLPGCKPDVSGGPEDGAPSQTSSIVQQIEDAAHAAMAVMGMAREADDERPAAPPPAVDPSDADPGAGDGLSRS